MQRLNRSHLHELAARCDEMPGYDFARSSPAIVHIGPGAFHRAHQALYTHEAMNRAGCNDWGITAVSLFSTTGVVADLPEQDYLYSVTELTPDGGRTLKLCTALRATLAAGRDRRAAVELLARAQTRIVSLTITEKGYCLSPSDGLLMEDDPLIQHDLMHPEHPHSAPGLIVAALAQRMREGLLPFTVLSCDNCPANGQFIRSAVLQLAERLAAAGKCDRALASHIRDEVCFPSSMVDRIVPAESEREQQITREILQRDDPCGIVCESFRQWVIEDTFTAGRPDWHLAEGARFVRDVAPFEEMKLCMLNGAHSFLACAGLAGGYETVRAAMQDRQYRLALEQFFAGEVIPVLDPPPQTDLHEYADSLIRRFDNPHIAHRTAQIATDTSCKIPQRWLKTAKALLEQGRPFPVIATGIAAWIYHICATDTAGKPVPVSDPLSSRCQELTRQHAGNPDALAEAVLHEQEVFDPALLA